jgi:hypothetical protein
MKPLIIVISIDVSEQIVPGSIPGWVASLVHEFGFDRANAAFHRRTYQQLACRGAGAPRAWYTSHPLRRGRLQRFAAARRSPDAGLDAKQLDGRDAAFADRYAASADSWRVKSADIGVEGGWRIYSSGPGIFTSLLVHHLLGHRRLWGEPIVQPLLPIALQDMVMELNSSV